jgi:catechol 2,3-dioxygenase-like lactoylglutathione lyase family enzyme
LAVTAWSEGKATASREERRRARKERDEAWNILLDLPLFLRKEKETMELGAFSVSLAVKDITASRAFYEKLGFKVVGGEQEHKWLIMRNGSTNIGLFQGMFERNILTFNPGWDQEANPLPSFADVREIQRLLRSRGLALTQEADESGQGPAHIAFLDPDGNPVLVDQHV